MSDKFKPELVVGGLVYAPILVCLHFSFKV